MKNKALNKISHSKFNFRLKKYCHAEFISVSYIFCKRGAMFGLDARIALAIFGALSVITGAVLYSAIGRSKTVAVYNEMVEVSKAYEAYYLDTNQHLPKVTNDDTSVLYYRLKTVDLAENTANVKDWKGPYLKYEKDSTYSTRYLRHNNYGTIHVDILNDSNTWGGSAFTGGTNFLNTATCKSNEMCFLWVQFNHFEDDDIALEIDKMVDGGDGLNKGTFRWWYGDAYGYRYALRIMPVSNPKS